MSFGRTNLFHPPANHSLIYLQHSYFTKGSQDPILGLLNKRLPHSNDTKNELKILQTCEVTNSSPIHFCKFPTTLFLRNILIVLKILKEFLLSFFDLSFFCLIQTLLSSIIRNVITDFFFKRRSVSILIVYSYIFMNSISQVSRTHSSVGGLVLNIIKSNEK